MKLDKSQALLLSKIVFNHVHVYPDLYTTDIENLLKALNQFLIDDGSSVVSDDDDEEDEDNHDDDEDDDDDEEDEEEDEPESAHAISASDLHDLSPALQIGTGELEFECNDENGSVDVLVNGYPEVYDIGYVRRKEASIDVWSTGKWHSWPAIKVPKSWKKKLQVDVVYEVDE